MAGGAGTNTLSRLLCWTGIPRFGAESSRSWRLQDRQAPSAMLDFGLLQGHGVGRRRTSAPADPDRALPGWIPGPEIPRRQRGSRGDIAGVCATEWALADSAKTGLSAPVALPEVRVDRTPGRPGGRQWWNAGVVVWWAGTRAPNRRGWSPAFSGEHASNLVRFRGRIPISNLKAGAPILVLGGAQDALYRTPDVHDTARLYGTEATVFPEMGHEMMWNPVGRWSQAACCHGLPDSGCRNCGAAGNRRQLP